MERSAPGTFALDRELDDQTRAQERQLVWVRLAVVVLGIGFLAVFGEPINGRVGIIGLLGGVALYSALIALLVRRLPPVPVAALGIALDVIAVTGVVWLASNVPDSYLFYGLVILGTAIRFGMLATIACAVVSGAVYLGVVTTATASADDLRELLPVRLLYLVSLGVVAGLFSRIIIERAAENARLQRRLDEEEQARERARERDVLARVAREFGASLELAPTLRAIAAGVAGLVGDAVALMTHDPDDGTLTLAATNGADASLVARWAAALRRRARHVESDAIGRAVLAGTAPAEADGADHVLAELGAAWLLAAPITAGGRVLGVLAVAGRAETPLDERTRRVVEAIADRAGPALQNALLWSDLQERVVREQEAQRTKDDFLSVVSHELRTPLTSIQGYSQLLEARLRDKAGSKEMGHLQVILSQVTRMRRLVDDLLDMNRMDRRGEVGIAPVDFDFSELVVDAANRLVRAEPDREIELVAPPSLPVRLDRERMDQVVMNLLENAVKYSPEGGPIRVALTATDSVIEFEVADTGIGIPEADRERVFERFYQADDDQGRRRFGGLGLGLAISRGIVLAHSGEIWSKANREAGKGSIFGFRVPRTADARGDAELDADAAPAFVRRSPPT